MATDPVLEIYRSHLHRYLWNIVRAYNVRIWSDAVGPDRHNNILTRWLINQNDGSCLFPADPYEGDPDLRAYFGESEALNKIEKALIETCKRCRRTIDRMKDHQLEYTISAEHQERRFITLIPIVESSDPAFAGYNSVRIRIEDYERLLSRINPEDINRFNDDLYCMLKRYMTLHGPKYHTLLPYSYMEYLTGLGVTYEAFAHPVFEQSVDGYGSMYRDVDDPFNSFGSFRDILRVQDRHHVGIEATPPPVMGIMEDFIDDLECVLEDSEYPITVICHMPVWSGFDVYERYGSSKFLVHSLNLSKHEYRHDVVTYSLYPDTPSSDRSGDITVFVYQNLLAYQRYPLPADFDEMVRKTFT